MVCQINIVTKLKGFWNNEKYANIFVIFDSSSFVLIFSIDIYAINCIDSHFVCFYEPVLNCLLEILL